MGYLSKRDVAALLDCARVMYSGVGRPDFHIHVITALNRALSSTITVWVRMEMMPDSPPVMTVHSYPLGHFPPSFVGELAAHSQDHPAFLAVAQSIGMPLQDGLDRAIRKKFSRDIMAQRAVRISDAEPKVRHRATRFYKVISKPHGLDYQLGFFPTGNVEWMGAIIFCRADKDFAERERRMLDMLVPHIKRAFAHDRAADRREQVWPSAPVASAADIHGCNALVLDPTGGLRFCTDGARIILGKHFGLDDVRQNRLPAEIMACLNAGERGEKMLSIPGPVSLKTKQGGLLILVGSPGLDRAVPLYLDEASDGVKGGNALTDRESDVLYWVAAGKTNKDVAKILSISPNTVRAHLEHIYKKLGVENRTSASLFARQRTATQETYDQ